MNGHIVQHRWGVVSICVGMALLMSTCIILEVCDSMTMHTLHFRTPIKCRVDMVVTMVWEHKTNLFLCFLIEIMEELGLFLSDNKSEHVYWQTSEEGLLPTFWMMKVKKKILGCGVKAGSHGSPMEMGRNPVIGLWLEGDGAFGADGYPHV